MKKKYYILLSLISLALFFGISVLGGYPGHHIKFLVAAIVYSTLTYIVLSRNPDKKNQLFSLLIILLPSLLIDIPFHIIDYQETRMSLPSSLAYIIGIGFGLLIYYSRLYLKIILGSVLIAFSIWMAVSGYTFWLHKVNFGSFSGFIHEKKSFPIEGVDQSGNHIDDSTLRDKIIVIDFWNTHCGVCFREFPEYQKLYDDYKETPSLLFLAIDKPLPQDTVGQAFSMITTRGYTFPVLVPDDKSLPEKFGVTGYPTVVIINEDGIAVFRGSVEQAGKVIRGLIKYVD